MVVFVVFNPCTGFPEEVTGTDDDDAILNYFGRPMTVETLTLYAETNHWITFIVPHTHFYTEQNELLENSMVMSILEKYTSKYTRPHYNVHAPALLGKCVHGLWEDFTLEDLDELMTHASVDVYLAK